MVRKNPKVFISYSWTSDEYCTKVLELASRLVRDGVDVILDQWDLDYGQDMPTFMEQSIKYADKVLILCDERYVDKANKREGGVGTETLIISPEVYAKHDQTKFLPVIINSLWKMPTYLKGRRAVEFISGNPNEYRNLYRAIFGKKPKKPSMGSINDDLLELGLISEKESLSKTSKIHDAEKPRIDSKAEKPALGRVQEWILDDKSTSEITMAENENLRNAAYNNNISQNYNQVISDKTHSLQENDRNIAYGCYPRINESEQNKLLWRVLDIDSQNNRALLITEKLIECRPYHKQSTNITWEYCDLRRWLNEEFLSEAFDENERKRIALVHNQNSDNKLYNTLGGNPTYDRIFALSIEETNLYFKNKDDSIASLTTHVFEQTETNTDLKRWIRRLDNNEFAGWWWLRSPGCTSKFASSINDSGGVRSGGYSITFSGICVRPALWLTLQKTV